MSGIGGTTITSNSSAGPPHVICLLLRRRRKVQAAHPNLLANKVLGKQVQSMLFFAIGAYP